MVGTDALHSPWQHQLCLPVSLTDLQPVVEITEFQQYCGKPPCCKASSDLGDPKLYVGGMLFPGIFSHAKGLAKY